MNFAKSEWRGIAEVCFDDSIQTIDTYQTDKVDLGRSSTVNLIRSQARKLLVYSTVMLLATVCLLYLVYKKTEVINWAEKHKWHLLYAGIAICQFAFAVRHSETQSFWADEMFEIGWSVQANTLLDRLFVDLIPRPIFNFFFYFWYKVAPYGEKWLLLPMELATAIGIYFCGLCAKKCRDGKAGLFAVFFAVMSGTILVKFSYEIRSYPFFFCFSAILLFMNLKRWEHPGKETSREIILTSIVMTVFAGMHVYAVFICMLLFCVDIYLCFKEKSRPVVIIPYFIAAASYIPVIFVMLRNIKSGYFNTDSFWTPKPTVSAVIELLSYLCGGIKIVTVFFLLMVARQITIVFYSRLITEESDNHDMQSNIWSYILFVCAGNIIMMYLYGKLRPSATFWSSRYFAGLIPMITAISGIGAGLFCDWTKEKTKDFKEVSSVAAVLIILYVFQTAYPSLLPQQVSVADRWRESADWLYTQPNTIYNKDTLVIQTRESAVTDGWNEYYLTQQGRRDQLNVITQNELDVNMLDNYDYIYVVSLHNTQLKSVFQKVLDSQFKLETSRTDIPIKVYLRK